jgi:hypothetical protein
MSGHMKPTCWAAESGVVKGPNGRAWRVGNSVENMLREGLNVQGWTLLCKRGDCVTSPRAVARKSIVGQKPACSVQKYHAMQSPQHHANGTSFRNSIRGK